MAASGRSGARLGRVPVVGRPPSGVKVKRAASAAVEAAKRPAAAPRTVIRGESPLSPISVSVDWLSFSFLPPPTGWVRLVQEFLGVHFGLCGWEVMGGYRGYSESARVDGAIVAWGGESQRGSVHVSLSAECLSQCDSWPAVCRWLEDHSAKLTRVDLAADDFFGERLSFAWAVDQLRAGGFTLGGRKPSGRFVTHDDDGLGNTVYVGKRENGKLCRVYEKGKQLGDRLSKWCRFEVEWRAKDRVLPLDMLLAPARYLAGAYPCAAFVASVAERLRTVKQRAVISFKRAVEIARVHAGRVVNMILEVNGGDIGACVNLLRRAGLPSRVHRSEVLALQGT